MCQDPQQKNNLTDNRLEYQENSLYMTVIEGDLPGHMLITGRSGMGKTRACLELIKSNQNSKQNKEE